MQRARQEYRKMVNGCEIIAKEHQLYFMTITCRGRELNYDDAIAGYLGWTNALFTLLRQNSRRKGNSWSYVQVTEHQQKTRAHPHSHIVTTFLPTDALQVGGGEHRVEYSSEWFRQANINSGLGEQCRLSKVYNAAAVSRYVAKYMFKSMMSASWPPHWRRVRYSQNWPKLSITPPELVIVLRTKHAWDEAQKERVRWLCGTREIFELAAHRIANVTM